MGKRYDAEKVADFIHVLSDSVNKYGSRAELLKENYKKYISNEKYRGDLADESKKYLSLKQIQLHEGVVWIQQKILKIYTEIESDFKESVDRSEKARIDTDVLITTKKDFCIYQNAVDVHGGAIEDEAAWLEEELEGYLSFTQPSFDDPRKEYDDFCGKGKFLDKCLEKFEKFDSDACDYVNRTGLEDIIDEHRRDISKAVSDLNKVTDFRPEVEKIELTSLAVGAKAIVNATENSNAQMTQDEKVDLWLTPGYKLSEAEIKEARAICAKELSKINIEPTNANPVSDEDKLIYERYSALRIKCDKFSAWGTGFTMPFAYLIKFGMDLGEDISGTIKEMFAGGLFGYDSDIYLKILGQRENYSENTKEALDNLNKQKANAITQNPDEYTAGYIMGQATAYYVTSPAFKGMASSAGITSDVGQFMANQFGQNWQDIMIDTNALYEELKADGELSSSDRSLLVQNVVQNAVMNLTQAEAEAMVDIVTSSKSTKSLAELKKIGQSSDDTAKIANQGDEVIKDGSHLNNGELKPNIKYQTGEHEYIYETNGEGLISRASTDNLQVKTHEGRLAHNSNTYGKEAGDQAGHIFGDRFGGSPELDNLVSQAQKVNQSEFKIIENEWAKALNNGKKVMVDIEINYDGISRRTKSFDISYTIDDIPFYKHIDN